jgi:hypothetical protein
MRFETMYNKLEEVAYNYKFNLSEVFTIWDLYTNKELRWCEANSSDVDLAIRLGGKNLYDFCREDSLAKVDRYFRFKRYKKTGGC